MVYIIIPVFNRRHFTKACLQSLYEQNFREFKVVVVDHGSTDGTSDMISADFTEVVLVKSDDSLWWTGAVNLGVNTVLGFGADDNDFILTLNNDLVVHPDYITQLLKIYHSQKPCIVGSISVYYDNPEKIQFAGIKWNAVSAKFKKNALTLNKYSAISPTAEHVTSDLLTGRGTLIPVTVFKNYGIYDEDRFPHYAADEDFSLICKRNGYKLLVAIKAVVFSHVADTGLNFNHSRLNFKEFWKTLFSIKSANNLAIRFKWAKKNSRFPVFYFLVDVTRIFGSYGRSMLTPTRFYIKNK